MLWLKNQTYDLKQNKNGELFSTLLQDYDTILLMNSDPVPKLPSNVKLKGVIQSFRPQQPVDGCSVEDYYNYIVKILKQSNQPPTTYYTSSVTHMGVKWLEGVPEAIKRSNSLCQDQAQGLDAFLNISPKDLILQIYRHK